MIQFSGRCRQWTDPFELFQVEDVISPADGRELFDSAPTTHTDLIAVQDPRHEKQYRMNLLSLVEAEKRTHNIDLLPANWRELVDDLLSPTFTTWLEQQVDVVLSGLRRSIGLYTHRNGDFLSVHKDKPTKALTAILYLNWNWPLTAGGRFQMFASGDPGAQPHAELSVQGGHLVAFKPTESSWHAVSPVSHPDHVERVTVQIEYWLSTELMGSAYKPSMG